MRQFYELHREAIDRATFLIFVVLSVYVFFNYLFAYVAPFFFGLLIALIMEPLIRLLLRKGRLKRWLAALICLLLFLIAVGSLGTVVVSNVYRQIGALMDNAPQYIDDFSRRLDSVNEWISAWSDQMPDSFYVEFPDIKDALLAGLTSLFGDGVKDKSLRIVSNVPDFFVGIIMTLVSCFFFMKDGPLITQTIARHSPKWLTRNLLLVRSGLSRAIGGYFRAQLTLMAMVGTICIAGLLIMRNPYALLIGLIIAALDFLPVFGSGTLLIPWILISLLTGQFSRAVGLLLMYGVVTVVRQVMEPKILGEQIGVHPLVTLISVYAGYKIFGVFGILIGPSLAIVIKAVGEAKISYENETEG